MTNYDFKTLSPLDFEVLTRDLLQEELKITLENFKQGKDGGVDCRYCKNNTDELVIQCKHRPESSFNKLFRMLEKEEKKKVEILKTNRYILAISISLTVYQKRKIRDLFTPYIVKQSDIYDKNNLNNLLTKFPKIEKQQFKLWLSSVNILEEIFHSKIKNFSKMSLEKMKEDAKYYVQNKSFSEALEVLTKYNVCIIAGNPGVGKTMLAEMLCLQYLNQGYEIIKISSDISEASEINDSGKKVFYYDDFLGQVSQNEKLNKNEDERLVGFINSIRKSKFTKFILTTREYILNQAKMSYEKIDREIFDKEKYVVDISKYTRLIKAKILYNHLYFLNIHKEYIAQITNEKRYLKIIDHVNYNPRIIETMCNMANRSSVDPNLYYDNFIKVLDNPECIWDHAFNHQLSESAKDLLIVIASLSGEVFKEDLCKAYCSFHSLKSEKYKSITSPRDFINSLKELDGNFVVIEKSRDNLIIKFQNPSIKDYLHNYLGDNKEIIKILISTSVYFEQINWLWSFRKEFQIFTDTGSDNSILLEGIKNTLYANGCHLINVRNSTGEEYVERSVNSERFEIRVLEVYEIYRKVPSQIFIDYVNELLSKVDKRIDKKEVDKWALWRLMQGLADRKITVNIKLLEKSKEYLINDMVYLELYTYAGRFAKLYPELISRDEKKELKKKFYEYIHNDELFEVSDPQILRQDADDVKEIAKILSVGSYEIVKRMNDRADEIESHLQDREEDSEKDYGPVIEDNRCNDIEIDSIFSKML